MEIQWFPGHMTKAMRQMREDMKLIDLVIELVDARVPVAGRNPDLESLGAGKARIILLNKSDLSDAKENERWKSHFLEAGMQTVLLDAQKNHGMNEIRSAVQKACAEKIERDRRRGINNRPVRAMVVGIPNVGKSTFINSFAKKAVAKTGNRPGITKGKQWIRLDPTLELLDTPGVLWPKFEDPEVGLHLAMIGTINDEILHTEELALECIDFLKKAYAGRLSERYGVSEDQERDAILLGVAERLGCLKKGGVADLERAAKLLIEDLRSGKLGRLTIEKL